MQYHKPIFQNEQLPESYFPYQIKKGLVTYKTKISTDLARSGGFAKIRYSARPAKATISPMENGRVKVSFEDKQRAITKGQSVVFYKDDLVVGGGIIESLL